MSRLKVLQDSARTCFEFAPPVPMEELVSIIPSIERRTAEGNKEVLPVLYEPVDQPGVIVMARYETSDFGLGNCQRLGCLSNYLAQCFKIDDIVYHC